jgi:hypothetical protein
MKDLRVECRKRGINPLRLTKQECIEALETDDLENGISPEEDDDEDAYQEDGSEGDNDTIGRSTEQRGQDDDDSTMDVVDSGSHDDEDIQSTEEDELSEWEDEETTTGKQMALKVLHDESRLQDRTYDQKKKKLVKKLQGTKRKDRKDRIEEEITTLGPRPSFDHLKKLIDALPEDAWDQEK